jgi:uncharacterized protein (UPF0297 family)
MIKQSTRINMSNQSSCFTYKVEMIVQVLATDEESARNFLNQTGGYIVSRDTTLIDTSIVYEG